MQDFERDDLDHRGIDQRDTFASVLDRHLSRRALLKGGLSLPALTAAGWVFDPFGDAAAQSFAPIPFEARFASVPETAADTVTVPAGYRVNVIIRWGDPLFPGMAPFNVNAQSAVEQSRRFGFNNDMVALFPATFGTTARDAYIMCVNHEYSSGPTMFPDYPDLLDLDPGTPATLPTRAQMEIEMQAHGMTVCLIRLVNGAWVPDLTSPYQRRITATTPMLITGPAAGDALLKTASEPTGTMVLGTLNNCSGGQTPWGTYLSAEENWNQYFNFNNFNPDPVAKADHTIHGVTSNQTLPASGATFHRFWENFDPRFNVSLPQGINEPFRFGWIAEIDPYDASSAPRKRTALGRFKHEAAQVVVSKRSNRVVVYTGDDERFEYVYKFVSQDPYFAPDRFANMDLLDRGTLYVARFDENGTGAWLPMTFEAVNARAPGRFRNLADVLIRTRQAADTLGATPMDRPEDIEAPRDADWFGNGYVYMVMTKNDQRAALDPANPAANAAAQSAAPRGRNALANASSPRGSNAAVRTATNPASLGSVTSSNVAGHIIQVLEDGNDPASLTFRWGIYLLAGDPNNARTANPAGTSAQNVDVVLGGTGRVQTFVGDRFANPDNIAFDSDGSNIFIATDGNPEVFPCNDQVLVAPAFGAFPRPVKRFLVGPKECEICGPTPAPDDATFFCAIQHPGENGVVLDSATNARFRRTSSWPDGGANAPRPAVVAVRRTDGGRIGS